MIIGNWEIEIVKESGEFKQIPIPGSTKYRTKGNKRFELMCKHVPSGLIIPREVWFLKPYTESEFSAQLTEYTKSLDELVTQMENQNG
jgi:hypothetical protein